MDFGNFNIPITILVNNNKAEELDGSASDLWTTFIDCWASKISKSGVESFQNGQLVGEMRDFFTFWFIKGIEPYMRLKNRETGEIYDIVHVAQIGHNEAIRCECFIRDNENKQ